MNKKKQNNNFSHIVSIIFTCILMGGLIGALTNMVNGFVSPYYFKVIMRWDFDNIWKASVAQGIFEGLLYGIIFSIIFTISYSVITKGKGLYLFAIKQLTKVFIIVASCWLIGGILAILLALLSPDFYSSHFYRVPNETGEMIKYAWVGGSIWGEIFGGLISTVLSIFVMKNDWNKIKNYC